MKKNLRRPLQPNTVALFGGIWAENVAYQIKDSNFSGEVWPVNPNRKSIMFLLNLFPMPDFWCFTTGDPKQIWSRKKEIKFEILKMEKR